MTGRLFFSGCILQLLHKKLEVEWDAEFSFLLLYSFPPTFYYALRKRTLIRSPFLAKKRPESTTELPSRCFIALSLPSAPSGMPPGHKTDNSGGGGGGVPISASLLSHSLNTTWPEF